MFVSLDNLDSDAQEFVLGVLADRSDPLEKILELEAEALERGYEDVHAYINDLKQTGVKHD